MMAMLTAQETVGGLLKLQEAAAKEAFPADSQEKLGQIQPWEMNYKKATRMSLEVVLSHESSK